MKRNEWTFAVLIVVMVGCIGPVHHVKSGGNPDAEDWRKILIVNDSPYYLEYIFGSRYILDPGRRMIHVAHRFGDFEIMVYAWRKFSHGNLSWFVGQRKIRLRVDGRARMYKGRSFADWKKLREHGWKRTNFGHPTKYSGRILGIIPWEFNIKTKSPRRRPRH